MRVRAALEVGEGIQAKIFMRRPKQRTKRQNSRSERARRITAVAAVLALLAAGLFAARDVKIQLTSAKPVPTPSDDESIPARFCLCRMTAKSAAASFSTTAPDN
jgi:hypothetical protein